LESGSEDRSSKSLKTINALKRELENEGKNLGLSYYSILSPFGGED